MNEALVLALHFLWRRWISLLISKSIQNPDGSITIPVETMDRWIMRSARTPQNLSIEDRRFYNELSQLAVKFLEKFFIQGFFDTKEQNEQYIGEEPSGRETEVDP